MQAFLSKMPITIPEKHALYPLTVFDALFQRTTFVTGWLLEGDIDAAALAAALDRLTHKWRLLSGRLHSIKAGNDTKWYVKIPLGPIPEDYPTYALTTSISPEPLSKYVKVPIPSTSTSLPMSVFLDSQTPRQYADWESKAHPLTCWNVVSFPAPANNGVSYTGIGFARCHGVFDGGGASQVMDALIAEIKGQEWTVPLDPHEGLNINPVEQFLAEELRIAESPSRKEYQDYSGYTPLGAAGFVKLAAYHTKEKWWNGADRRIVLLPEAVLRYITEDVKASLRKENRQVENVSTGDILVAWILKTVYSAGVKPETVLHCTNLGSFRNLLRPNIETISTYPHNAFAPLPYPLLTTADIQAFPLHSLANLFAASRASFSLHHVVAAYKILHQTCFPNPPGAEETLNVSNVSASRILESDWACLGSKRTLCGYRYQATPTDTMFTNAVYIAGRLDDGTVVLDVTLNKARFDLLSGEIQRLSAQLARNQLYGGNSVKSKGT